MALIRHTFIALIVSFIGVTGAYLLAAQQGWLGQDRGPGEIIGAARSDILVQARDDEQKAIAQALHASRSGAKSASEPKDKQILFGDLHVHTTNSTDAFLWSLPIYGGEGSHPLADACDYARHCSALDFWSITDHAEASTPKRWEDAKQSIRACNAKSSNGESPDMVSFVGFEWTQVGARPEEHYGHKNVIFQDLEDAKLAKRPIASGGITVDALRTNGKSLVPLALAALDFENRQDYYDIRTFLDQASKVPLCAPDVPADELSAECFEIADTPGALVKSLEQQKLDPLIIPHGTSWGMYTPTGTTFDKHLKAANRPEAMQLMEVMSGHGNSEEYRDWRSVIYDATTGLATCPAPTPNYLPSCWQAGTLIQARCLADGESPEDCQVRAAEARYNAANASVAAHITVPGTPIEDWLDAGQCKDCFLPGFGHRPGNSLQYALAIRNFDDTDKAPTRLNWGVIASSDNHRARPGTGYKDIDRLRNTEAVRLREDLIDRVYPKGEKKSISEPLDQDEVAQRGFGATELERQASFWTTGGLAAVHAQGRSREEIFAAMKARETYGTSGARILLWFNTQDGTQMGSTTQASKSPVFEVKAVGAHKQKPGCPEDAATALGADRLQKLCANECFNPSEERLKITRIEVVRIRPQTSPEEDVADLIEDKWKVHRCRDTGNGCSFTFTDPEFAKAKRMATYYVRAIQEPTKKINADNLRCTYDDKGNCLSLNICYGDDRTDATDDCLAPVEERAWSSPIYVEHNNSKFK